MRTLAHAACLLLAVPLAACGEDQLTVRVTRLGGLPAHQLQVSLVHGLETRALSLPSTRSPTPLGFPASFVLRFTRGLIGAVELTVDASSAAGGRVATGRRAIASIAAQSEIEIRLDELCAAEPCDPAPALPDPTGPAADLEPELDFASAPADLPSVADLGPAPTTDLALPGSVKIFGDNTVDDVRGVTSDSSLLEDLPTTNAGTATYLAVERDPPDSRVSVLRFALDSLPTTTTIERAELIVQVRPGDSSYLSDDPIFVHRVLEPWDEATVAWQQRLSGTSWLGAGCDGASRETASVGSFEPSAATSYTLDVTALVSAWIASPASNHGVVLRGSGSNSAQLVSSEGTDGLRPRLRVVLR